MKNYIQIGNRKIETRDVTLTIQKTNTYNVDDIPIEMLIELIKAGDKDWSHCSEPGIKGNKIFLKQGK